MINFLTYEYGILFYIYKIVYGDVIYIFEDGFDLEEIRNIFNGWYKGNSLLLVSGVIRLCVVF